MSASTLSTPEGTQAACGIAEYLRQHPLQNRSEIISGTGADPRLFDAAYRAGWFRAVELGYISDDWMQTKMIGWLQANATWRFDGDRQAQRAAAVAAAAEFEALRDRLGIPFPCLPG